MFTTTKNSNGFAVSIVLASGVVAGTGYGQEEKTAMYFACKDAVLGGHGDAGRGHSRFLSEAEENSIRALG